MTAPLRLCVRRSAAHSTDGPGGRVEFSLRVPTELDVVEEVVDLVARHSLASGLAPQLVRFNLRVALAEALVNAIVYGNGLDRTKCVQVRVAVEPNVLTIQVHDEGAGFDPTTVPDPTRPDRLERPDGRGLFLIRQLVDEVQFNDRGNSICMIMRCA